MNLVLLLKQYLHVWYFLNDFISYIWFEVLFVWIFSHLSPVAGMKYDLKRVEEVYYDVKIRGLTAQGDSIAEQEIQG